jgi:hypothetical protein
VCVCVWNIHHLHRLTNTFTYLTRAFPYPYLPYSSPVGNSPLASGFVCGVQVQYMEKSISSKSENSTNGCLSRVELRWVQLHFGSGFDCMYCYTDRGILVPFPEGKETSVSAMGPGGLRLQPAYSSQGTGVSSAAESGRGVRVASHLHVVPRLRINSATTPIARRQCMTCTLTFSMSLR